MTRAASATTPETAGTSEDRLSGEEPVVHVLEGPLDLTAAASFAMALRDAVGLPLRLDASGVRSLGGLCFQILLAAVAQWKADGQPFSVVSPSAAFSRDYELLGGRPGDIEL